MSDAYRNQSFAFVLLKSTKGFLQDIFTALRIALLPTLRAIWDRPKLLMEPRSLSQTFMANAWVPFGDGIDLNSRKVKDGLVRKNARGVVLDVGAGYGHLAAYLDHDKVTAYIALEPNTLMHARLREKASSYGFEESKGNFLIIGCGAEEIDRISLELSRWSTSNPQLQIQSNKRSSTSESTSTSNSESKSKIKQGGDGMVIDTLICILTICSLPSPTRTIHALIHHTLQPRGQLLFYEHVRNPRLTVARVQDFVAPLWKRVFDGCVVGVDAVRAIWDAGFEDVDLGEEGRGRGRGRGWEFSEREGGRSCNCWSEMKTWGLDDEDMDSLFWHQVGRCVKKE